MNSRRFSWIGLTAALVTVSAAAMQARAETLFNVVDLGTLGETRSGGTCINDVGQAAGFSWTPPDGPQRSFRTAPNSPINPLNDGLGTLVGDTTAQGINAAGQVVGKSYVSGSSAEGGVVHAFRTAPNAPIDPSTDDLGTLGGDNSLAIDINNLGQVTGWAELPSGEIRAFLTGAGEMIDSADDLGSLGWGTSVGHAVNDQGVVVGHAHTAEGYFHAFCTEPGQPIDPTSDDLGTLGGRASYGTDINNLGGIVGNAHLEGDEAIHAFYLPEKRTLDPNTDDLGTLGGDFSSAWALNEDGVVVGNSDTESGADHAFVWFGQGPLQDLNALIPAGSGWELVYAHDINAGGQIVGWGYYEGEQRAFRLDPIPEPASLALLVLGGAILTHRRGRAAWRQTPLA